MNNPTNAITANIPVMKLSVPYIHISQVDNCKISLSFNYLFTLEKIFIIVHEITNFYYMNIMN